jgi:cardiolipin synthase (CMP-forming)
VTLPNLISLSRLLGVPLIVWLLMSDAWGAAFVVFVLAGLSDAVDGFLAKRLGLRSQIGAFLDPVADKTLLVSIYLTLGIRDALPHWLVILVVSRDLLIVGGALMLFLLNHGVSIAPSYISKVNTALQIAFAALVIGRFAFALNGLDGAIVIAGLIVGASTIISGAGYLIAWARRVAAMEGGL